jgi:hypothetical protein
VEALFMNDLPTVQVVIPLHHKGGARGNDLELRLALRSLARHFRQPFEVTVVARKLPPWLTGARLIECRGGLKSALQAAADAYPDGFFWYYDDTCLIRDTVADEMKITSASPGWRSEHQTGWSAQLEEIRARLVSEGYEARDYSRQHGPYWFDRGMVSEAFSDWEGMAGKFPFESWILSKRKWPYRLGAVKQYYGDFNSHPGPHHYFINFNGRGFSDKLIAHLQSRFPRPSRFENDAGDRGRTVEVHTIRYGDAWWLRACSKTLDDWAERHGHKLRVWGPGDIPDGYPSAKFCEIDMLREFLAGKSDWLIYVDADVYVKDDAPAHPFGEVKDGFHIRPDIQESRGVRAWPRWVRRRIPDPENIRHGWVYRNAGVWACDRGAAREMLAVIEAPFFEGYMEQHQWNWWLASAASRGMKVVDLPKAWNSYPRESDASDRFLHLAGRRKASKWRDLVARGLIPVASSKPRILMKTFDDSPYAFTGHDNGWDTDDLHIHLLHEVAKLPTGTPPGQRVAVEVGSFRGRSTAALVEAVNQGFIDHLHVVEVRPTASLRKVIGMCADPSKVTLHTTAYWDLKIGPADVVFIDGDHRWPAVGDTLRALTWGAKILCLHDTQAWPRMKDLWGSHIAGRLLKDAPGRHWFEDAVDREGLRTFRGFLVSAEEGIDLSSVRALAEAFDASGTDPADSAEDEEGEEESEDA